MTQALAAPRERLITLPPNLPERSLGYGVAAWMMDNLTQPNGPHAGEPFRPTDGQIEFLVHFYALAQDGTFLYKHAARRLVKGSGKSPFAAAMALAELLGPVQFVRFDDSAPFGVVAKPMGMPLVQVVATSERQTANTMRMVRAFASKKTKLYKRYNLDVGKTYVDVDGGRLEQVTSSPHTLEGGEVTFYVADETEHWTPTRQGPELMSVLKGNVAKTPTARVLETSNAWKPGDASVAEQTFDDWCDQEDGLTRGELRILYDARIAPPNTVLTDDPGPDEVSLDEALRFVYADCPWKLEIPGAIEAIKEQIWTPSYPESRSWRFYLNRPTAAENAWTTLEEWTQLRDPDRVVAAGEKIVMFFDGSKSNDHTALVGCAMNDGHIFTLGHWRPEGPTRTIDAAAVDAGVRRAFAKYDVVAFWADVREFESFTKVSWPADFGENLICPAVRGKGLSASPIAWDMRSHAYQFAEAAEAAATEIQEKRFTHDGSSALGEHVANCRVNEYRGRFSVKKESPKSSRKIDLAVCMIGARMLYRHVLASEEWTQQNKPKAQWKVYM